MPSWLPAPVKSVMCSKLESELDRLMRSLEGLKSALIADIENIENLFILPFKSITDAMSDVNNMIQGLDSAVPNIYDLSSINSIITFLNRCLYIKEHPLLKDAYKMAQQLLDEYQEMAEEFIQEAIDGIPTNVLNHIDLGDKLNWYKEKLEKFKIFEKQQEVDDILICVQAICALDEQDDPIQEVQDYIDAKEAQLTSIRDDLRIVAEGRLDADKIFTNAGLNTDEQLIMSTTMDAVEHVKETFVEAQENLSAAIGEEDLPHPATELYTHYNDPTFVSTSTIFDQVDPNITYLNDFLETWRGLQLPSGTTTKKGMLDVKIEIDACTITETPDPNVNCFSTYKALLKIIIGFFDCTLSGNGTTATITQINHGYTSGDTIIINDATNDILEGDHLITVVDAHTYTFSSTFSGTDSASASSLFYSDEGEYSIGMPVCGTCGKYTVYGLSAASTEDLVYIRKHLSEAVKLAIAITLEKFSADEVESIIPNR